MILGIDPGFASTGWVVLDVDHQPVAAGVIRTKKSAWNCAVTNARRAGEIFDRLDSIYREHFVETIAAEAMSFPRNSSAAAKMAMCWGVICAVSQMYGIEIRQKQPQQIKKAICGRKDASKQEVEEEVKKLLPDLDRLLESTPKGQRNHAWDAAAATLALQSPNNTLENHLVSGSKQCT